MRDTKSVNVRIEKRETEKIKKQTSKTKKLLGKIEGKNQNYRKVNKLSMDEKRECLIEKVTIHKKNELV